MWGLIEKEFFKNKKRVLNQVHLGMTRTPQAEKATTGTGIFNYTIGKFTSRLFTNVQ
jgi:hypothetical protein